MQQRAFGGAGRDGVDAAQQQRVMGQQQPAIGYLGDDGGGGVDGDRHRVDVVVRIAADQADRVPVLRQPRRVRRIQHVDDVGQPGAHRSTSAIASTSTGQSGRTAARRNWPSRPTKVSQRRTAIPLASNRFRINSASGTLNRTNGAEPSTTVGPDRGQARHHLGAQLPPAAARLHRPRRRPPAYSTPRSPPVAGCPAASARAVPSTVRSTSGAPSA